MKRVFLRPLRRISPLGFIGLLLLFSIASCRTLPESPRPEILDWLPSSSSLVMRLEVPGNRALADLFLSSAGDAFGFFAGTNTEGAAGAVAGDADNSELKAVLDRTALLALGIEYSDDFSLFGSSVIHLAALGRWPRAFIGTSLPESWRKVKPYQWEGERGTALAAVSREEILFSAGRLDEMMQRRERGGAMPAVPKSDLMIRITDARLIDYLAPVIAGRIEGIELSLMRAEKTAYSASVNLYPADARLAGPLALAVRIALSSRFGRSPRAEERNLLSGTAVDIDAASGVVRADLPPMGLDIIGRILRGMGG